MTSASNASFSSTIDWTLGVRVKVTTLLDHDIIGTIYSFCQTTNTIALIQEPSTPQSSQQSTAPNYRIIKTSFIKDVTPLDNGKTKRAEASSQSPPPAPSAASVAAGTPHRDAFARASPAVSLIQVTAIEARARAAVKAERERRAKIGVGVTREAQELFDLISKTYVFKIKIKKKSPNLWWHFRESIALLFIYRLDALLIGNLNQKLTFFFFSLLFRVPCRWHDKSIIAMDEVRIDAPYRSNNCVADDPKSGALRYVKMLVDGAHDKMEKSKGGWSPNNEIMSISFHFFFLYVARRWESFIAP